MELFAALKQAWRVMRGEGENLEPWAVDEQSFEEHFGIAYEEFAVRVAQLDQAHSDLYLKTMACNPEAAIVWVFFLSS